MKFFDIIPPNKINSCVKEEKPAIKKKRSFNKSWVVLPLLAVFLIAFHFIFQKAEVFIWPEPELLTFQTQAVIASSEKEGAIKGEVFEESLEISRVFYSSGSVSKEAKAQGVIRVYNAYSTRSQVLVENTRFVSADGKLFRLIKRSTIPGGSYENNKLVPSYLDVEVRADQAGPEYNIEPSTFSIPGFVGTPMYTAFYGKSFQSMQGGFKGSSPQLIKEDLNKAEEILIEDLKKKIVSSIRNQASHLVFSEDFLETKVLDSFSLIKAGTETETFDYQVEISIKALLFKQQDLDNFVAEFIAPLIPEGKYLYEDSLKINYAVLVADLSLEETTLSLEMQGRAYLEMDESLLVQEITGKSLSGAKSWLRNQDQVIDADVKAFPFWVRSIPKDRVKLNFVLD